MKPENFEQVKDLMAERGTAEEKTDLLKQSNRVVFSKDGLGSVVFDIDTNATDLLKEFKDRIIDFWAKRIEIIDEKLKEL